MRSLIGAVAVTAAAVLLSGPIAAHDDDDPPLSSQKCHSHPLADGTPPIGHCHRKLSKSDSKNEYLVAGGAAALIFAGWLAVHELDSDEPALFRRLAIAPVYDADGSTELRMEYALDGGRLIGLHVVQPTKAHDDRARTVIYWRFPF